MEQELTVIRITNTLKKIQERLRGKRIVWAVVGSANLVLQGVPNVIPSDIDILTDRHGAYCFQSSLTDFCVMPIMPKENERYKSFYGKFKIDGIIVEVMGELQNKVPDKDLWGERSGFKDIQKIVVNNVPIPVVSLKREVIAFTAREKKDKVAILKKFLKKK